MGRTRHSAPVILSNEELERLSTKRLLAYRIRLLAYMSKGTDSEWQSHQEVSLQTVEDTYRACKNILAGREHIA